MRDHPPGFGLLGPVTVRDPRGAPVPVGPPMRQALLGCLLAAANRQVSRDRLLGDLWGPRPPASVRAALNNQISSLRRTLAVQGSATLRTVAGGYVLEVPDDELDVLCFERLLRGAQDARERGDWTAVGDGTAAALALWRGMPLEGLTSLAETEWYAPFTAHCDGLRMQALEWSVEAGFRLGRYQAVASRLAALVGEFPTNEGFHTYLMRCLAMTGRRADALEVYQRLRRTLVDELGIEPGEAARAVQARILAELPGGQAEEIEHAAAATNTKPDSVGDAEVASGPPPAQLPADVSDFVGRDDELRVVAEALSGAGGTVVAVTGMGGVGKTSLAVRAAREARSSFPDGQLYVDLHGFGKTPAREPHDVLAGLLASLAGTGAAGPVPEHTGDRAALLRSVLADRRVLLVLDNARDAEHVLPLLPGSGGCAAIVTSRSTLTDLPGAVHVGLDPLDPVGQHALLRALCGAERVAQDPDGAAAVLRACAGLPLALRISAARLASRPAWSLSTLAGQLDGSRGRLPALVAGHLALQSTFSTSYVALRDSEHEQEREAARAFRLLGLWPGHEFTPKAAAALLERSVDAATELLEFLADAHLVQTPQPLRYRMHDLLGEYAGDRAVEEEDAAGRNAAGLRLITWYLLALQEAAVHTGVGRNRLARVEDPPPAPLPEFADAQDARQWCFEELGNIKQAQRNAAVSARPEFTWRIGVGLFAYASVYWWTGEWDECLQLALTSAQQHDDLLGQAWSLNRMGVRYGMAFRGEEAIVMFEAELAVLKHLGDEAGRAATLMSLSMAHQQSDRFEIALHYAREGWELYEKIHGDVDDPFLISAFGAALFRAGEYEEAEPFLRLTQTLLEQRGNADHLAINLANLADTVRGLGRRDEAVDLVDRSIELRRQTGDIGGLCNGLAIKGRIHLHFDELEEARRALRQSLHLALEHQLPESMAEHARERLAEVEARRTPEGSVHAGGCVDGPAH